MIDNMLYILPENFSGCFVGGGRVCIASPFTHTNTLLHIMSRALYPGLGKVRIRKWLLSISMGCTSFLGFFENPN